MSIEAMGKERAKGWLARFRWSSAFVASLGLAGGVVLVWTSFAAAQQSEPLGTVAASQGEVSIARAAPPPGQVVPVRAGVPEQIFEGDVVKTGLNAKARLLLRDDSFLTLAEETELEITKALYEPAAGLRSTTVRLLHGVARAVVPPNAPHPDSRFTMETPTAVIGVRGSELILQVNEETLAICAQGPCEAGNVDPTIQVVVNLKAGQYTIVRPGERPTDPRPVPPRLLERLRRLTTIIQEAGLLKRDSGPSIPRHLRLLPDDEFSKILWTLSEENKWRFPPWAPHQSLIELGTPFHQDPSQIPEDCSLITPDPGTGPPLPPVLVCP